MLKAGGRAAIVIKNTFLSNMDNASIALRKELLESCNLHTILDLPAKTFLGAGVKTVVLFFEKPIKKTETNPSLSINNDGSFSVVAQQTATQKVWYYQLNLDRNLGKGNPLNEEDLQEFLTLQETMGDSDVSTTLNTSNSWCVKIEDIDTNLYDLSVKNPNITDEIVLREPSEIIDEMRELDFESNEILAMIQELTLSNG